MIREIVQKGYPVLAKTASPINFPTDKEEARSIAIDIVDTLSHLLTTREYTKGVGLAAPQIGFGKRMFGLAFSNEPITIFVNPEIIKMSLDADFQYEGCLSFFDVRGRVSRVLNLELRYYDVSGSIHEISFNAGKARIVQHEIDHIDGILYDQRMNGNDRLVPYSEYLNMKEKDWKYVP